MCPSLPLGRREREMEAGAEVGGTVPQGTLVGQAPGDPSGGVDVKGSGCRVSGGSHGVPVSTHSDVGRWLRAKTCFRRMLRARELAAPPDQLEKGGGLWA